MNSQPATAPASMFYSLFPNMMGKINLDAPSFATTTNDSLFIKTVPLTLSSRRAPKILPPEPEEEVEDNGADMDDDEDDSLYEDDDMFMDDDDDYDDEDEDDDELDNFRDEY